MSDRSFVESFFGVVGGLLTFLGVVVAIGASFGLLTRAFLWASGIDF